MTDGGKHLNQVIMGRTESSLALAPQAHRKEQRAKHARLTINKTMPVLLASDARARKGVEQAELIVDPQPTTRRPQNLTSADSVADSSASPDIISSGRRKKKGKDQQDIYEETQATERDHNDISSQPKAQLNIKIRVTDTLKAAHDLVPSPSPKRGSRKNVAILNMASPLRPGGGVLNGATSQEESLCVRTTLLPSLKEEWYRLPEVGGVWSPDVLVFQLGDDVELGKAERFWVDVLSAAMLRFPEVSAEEKAYVNEKDREMVVKKMKAVMNILQAKGTESVVLGAWGCGAYGNPIAEIVQAWKKVLLGAGKKKKGKNLPSPAQDLTPLKAVVFAIKDLKVAEEFAAVWGLDIEVEHHELAESDCGQTKDDEHSGNVDELREKIKELELQIPQVKTPILKSGLEHMLRGLHTQLATTESSRPALSEVSEDEDFDKGE